MKKTTLHIMDQVNIRFTDLDPHVRRDLVNAVKYFIPSARFTPAYKLGRWDGTMSFATVAGASYLNILDKLLPIVINAGYEVEIQDDRPEYTFNFPVVTEEIVSDRVWPKGHPQEGESIVIRDYQAQAINTYLNNLQSIQVLATGAGKSISTAIMSMMCEPYGRTILIVPSKSLVVQTEEDYINLGLDVGVFFGDRKEYGKTHTICTWQSLSALMKKDRDSYSDHEVTMSDFIDNVVAVIVDEVHSAKSQDLKTLLTGPLAGIPIRWGLTGTIPKEEADATSLLIGLGPVVGSVTAAELQERGVLSKCHVNILQTVDDHVEFDSYPEEVEYLTSSAKRMGYIAELASELRKSGNVLILVARIETGETLESLITDSVFISGRDNNKARQKEFKDVQTAEDKVLLSTFGVASTGLNLPRIFHLILIEPGKSFVRVIQSIGRGIRKAKDKDYVNIWDIASTCKFSAKHLSARKKFYKEANYPYDTTKVKYLEVTNDDLIARSIKKAEKKETTVKNGSMKDTKDAASLDEDKDTDLDDGGDDSLFNFGDDK